MPKLTRSACEKVAWTKLGSLLGFRYSTDFGDTCPTCPFTADSSLFSEDPDLVPVKIGLLIAFISLCDNAICQFLR